MENNFLKIDQKQFPLILFYLFILKKKITQFSIKKKKEQKKKTFIPQISLSILMICLESVLNNLY